MFLMNKKDIDYNGNNSKLYDAFQLVKIFNYNKNCEHESITHNYSFLDYSWVPAGFFSHPLYKNIESLTLPCNFNSFTELNHLGIQNLSNLKILKFEDLDSLEGYLITKINSFKGLSEILPKNLNYLNIEVFNLDENNKKIKGLPHNLIEFTGFEGIGVYKFYYVKSNNDWIFDKIIDIRN